MLRAVPAPGAGRPATRP